MTASANQTILSASSFVNSIGINTHVGFSWGAYNNLALVVDDLKYLGVTNLRDGLANSPAAQPVLDGLASAGYKFDLVVPSSVPAGGAAGLQQYLTAVDHFVAAHPGSVVALEGLNEVNIQSFNYNGSSSISAAAQFQAAYYAAIKGDAALAGTAVYNLTLGYNDQTDYAKLGNLSGSSDYANSHAYVSTGTMAQDAIQSQLANANSVSSGHPTVITETGYTTQSNTAYVGADQNVQAKSILNTLVDAYKDGVSTTYLYQLLDTGPTSSTDPEAHFGLFNADGTPKLAATAVHNLTTILSDNGTGGHQPTAPLGYSLSNMPASGQSMVLGKSNGAYDLVVWAEPKIWDMTTGSEISNPTQSVTVNLGGVHHSVNVYDPLSGTAPIATYTDVGQITVPISDHPLVIEIDAPVASAVVPNQPASVSGTAVSIVAQLSDLSASNALTTITLTDTHVLPVASEATMSYIISHYGKALAAIQGGYSFSVTTSTNAWSVTKIFDSSANLQSTSTSNYVNGVITSKVTVNADTSTDFITYTSGVATQEVVTHADHSSETKTFDMSGHLTGDLVKNTDGSTSNTLYSAGVKTKAYVTNADGSHDNYYYNITGQTFTAERDHIDATGKLLSITRTHADGSLDFTQVIASDGSNKVTTLFNATGHKTSMITWTPAATTTDQYDVSGNLKQEIVQTSTGSVTTSNYAGSVLASVYVVNANGSKETKLYDASGRISSDLVQNKDGSSSNTLYSAGVKTKAYVTNTDGSHDNSYYNIAGQNYTTETQHYDPTGRLTGDTRQHADGSLAYTQTIASDGSSKVTTLYDATGHKTNMTTWTPTATTTDLYDATGHLTQDIVQTANSVVTTNYTASVLASVYVVNSNGSKETKLYDATGHLASDLIQNKDGSSSNIVYTAGVQTKKYVTNTDGSHDNSYFNITGQSYTTETQHYDPTGKMTADTRWHADGSLAYGQTISSDGTKLTDLYDATGHKTSEVINRADGSSVNDAYTSGALVQDIVKTATGDVTTTNYSAGNTSSIYFVGANGAKDSKLFDAGGHLTSDYAQNTDSSSSTTVYSAGVKTATYVNNADGSHDYTFSNITGKTYVTELEHLDTAGKVTSDTRLHADGTFDSTVVVSADGSKVTDLYDSAGSKTQTVNNNANGTSDIYKYVVSGQPGAVEHDSYAAGGALLKIDVLSGSGSHNVTAVAAGQAIQGGSANDLFSAAPGSTTIMFDHGNDQINNFHAGTAANHDTIQIAKSLAADYSHLQITQSGSDALIHVSATDSITLKNVYASNLDHSNFLFV